MPAKASCAGRSINVTGGRSDVLTVELPDGAVGRIRRLRRHRKQNNRKHIMVSTLIAVMRYRTVCAAGAGRLAGIPALIELSINLANRAGRRRALRRAFKPGGGLPWRWTNSSGDGRY